MGVRRAEEAGDYGVVLGALLVVQVGGRGENVRVQLFYQLPHRLVREEVDIIFDILISRSSWEAYGPESWLRLMVRMMARTRSGPE